VRCASRTSRRDAARAELREALAREPALADEVAREPLLAGLEP
jgi:hypothetical protein